jgi:hypothetical protein
VRPPAFLGICLTLPLALAGCGISCTLIGCVGLVVTVTGAQPQATITVLATSPDSVSHTVTCVTSNGSCVLPLPYEFRPTTVTLRVSAGADTTTITVQPQYETSRPNGPDCPPPCQSATVAVAL